MILSASSLGKDFDDKTVLKDVTFHLEEKEKMALIGVNGAGKTTFFRILLGELEPDRGSVSIVRGTRLGYLPQISDYDSPNLIYDELRSVFTPVTRLEEEIRALERRISTAPTDALLERYARMTEEFEAKRGYEMESRIRGVLKGLGFKDEEYSLPVSSLSGGQKARVMLGKLLLSEPDVLLMDEPTNHLDIDATQWLEGYLASFPGACMIISHDRYFLDRLCTRTLEIERGVSTLYNGNYSYYQNEKAFREKIRMREYEAQQAEIKRQEEIAARLRSYNTEMFIKRAQSREKLLAKMERIKKPIALDASMKLHFRPQIRSADVVCEAEDVAKSFGANELFKGVSLKIMRGERVALIGGNGIGKTTFIRMLMGEEPASSGFLRLGVKVIPGYYDQTQENLHDDMTVLDEIYNAYPEMTLGEVRNVLGSFLFRGDDVFKPVGVLSGGERSRVSLCKIMLGEANFLLLDEPTNHLDIVSRQVLEDNLTDYEGTVLFVSHDRYFINRVATRILELTPHGVEEYLGNYDFYLEHKREPQETVVEAALPSEAKKEYLKQKQSAGELRRLRTRIRRLEDEISAAEARIAEISDWMLKPEYYNFPNAFRELEDERTRLSTEIEDKMAEWDELSMLVDE